MDGKSMPERVHTVDTSGMLANATPTKIAQEFILQYYSVRSRYPESLYRFYRDDSVVTMGCHQDETVVEGKKAIEQLFSRMDYQNSFNSVAAFSAHFVLPDCLAILVSGELSQNEEITRRFCEAFTLISYDANRFYVKSHMFHFQDEAFHDITPPSTTISTFEEPTKHNLELVEDKISNAEISVEPAVKSKQEESEELEEISLQAASDNRNEDTSSVTTAAVEVSHAQEDNKVSVQSDEPQTVAVEERPQTNAPQPVSKMTWAGVASASCLNHASLPIAKSNTDKTRVPTIQPAVFLSPVASMDGIQTVSEEKVESVPPSINGLDGRDGRVPRLSSSARAGRGGRPTKVANVRRGQSSSPQRDSSKDSVKYPDEQMLFVGNVPRDCAYEDLRELFEQFGTVLDLRINDSSLSRNGRSNANLPNYGFVVMESAEVVQTILEQRPLKLHGTQRINVEEKRVPSSSATRGSSGSYRGAYGYSRSSNTAASRQ